MKWLRWLWCRLGRHEGYVDGGFKCAHCPFEIPYEHDEVLIDRLINEALIDGLVGGRNRPVDLVGYFPSRDGAANLFVPPGLQPGSRPAWQRRHCAEHAVIADAVEKH